MSLSHCLSLFDMTPEQLNQVLTLAHAMKKTPANYSSCLQGKHIAMLFEKPSLRTRVSFDVGIHQLGGHAIYLDAKQVGPGSRETVTDIARNLACWTQAIVARVYEHNTLVELKAADVPVINALCDQHHPCQTLADLMTLQELYGEKLKSVHVAYVGDANNVCQSLMLGAAMLGLSFTVAAPPECCPPKDFLNALNKAYPGHSIRVVNNIDQIGSAQVVYTDTWISMGEEHNTAKKAALAPFQINANLIEMTQADHIMHCLPAHRDEEVTSELLDAHMSTVLSQAENRMHAQKALLATILSENK